MSGDDDLERRGEDEDVDMCRRREDLLMRGGEMNNYAWYYAAC